MSAFFQVNCLQTVPKFPKGIVKSSFDVVVVVAIVLGIRSFSVMMLRCHVISITLWHCGVDSMETGYARLWE